MWAKLPWDCKFVISNDVCDFALLKNTKGSESMGVMKISIEITTILDHSGVVLGYQENNTFLEDFSKIPKLQRT